MARVAYTLALFSICNPVATLVPSRNFCGPYHRRALRHLPLSRAEPFDSTNNGIDAVRSKLFDANPLDLHSETGIWSTPYEVTHMHEWRSLTGSA
jgi:hypothetical protein